MKGGLLSSELSSKLRKIIIRYHSAWSSLSEHYNTIPSATTADATQANSPTNHVITPPAAADYSSTATATVQMIMPPSVTKRSGARLTSHSSRKELSMMSFNTSSSPTIELHCDKSDREEELFSGDRNEVAASIDSGPETVVECVSLFDDNNENENVDNAPSCVAPKSPKEVNIDESFGIISYEYKKPVAINSMSSLKESPFCLPVTVPTKESLPKTSKSISMPRVKSSSATQQPEKKFTAQRRELLVKELFAGYNSKAFFNKLPADLQITWSKRLLTTAGITKSSYEKGVRVSSIELSLKVVVDERRLESTLLHELCHAASWIVDGERKPPHGGCFWKWAENAEQRVPGAQVTTCHSYDVHKAHRFRCLGSGCDMVYTRHSKKGIDVGRHRCGVCRGKLEYVGSYNADGSKKKEREANGFSLFVKANYDSVKNQMSDVKTKRAIISLNDSRDGRIDLTAYTGYSSGGSSTGSRKTSKDKDKDRNSNPKGSARKNSKAAPKMTDVMKQLGLMYKEMNISSSGAANVAAAEEVL